MLLIDVSFVISRNIGNATRNSVFSLSVRTDRFSYKSVQTVYSLEGTYKQLQNKIVTHWMLEFEVGSTLDSKS